MAPAALHCTFVLLLYLQGSLGQQPVTNQNLGANNPIGIQQQTLQWTPNNMNQIQNAGANINMVQQPNKQTNMQQSVSKQVNLQQSSSHPSNINAQTVSLPQNSFQITKIGFTPVSPGAASNPYSSTVQLQNAQVIQPQNIQNSNNLAAQISNSPVSTSTLAELIALKGQSSLLSLLNPQNNIQTQQNQQIVMPNSLTDQNQLTDAQKQFLVKSLQNNQQILGQNQGINFMQSSPCAGNIGNQAVTVRTVQGTPQGQAIVTPLGVQPPYITVQAQPVPSYLQYQTPQATFEEEPSIMSLILSELDPQYTKNSAYLQMKGSKPNMKTLIPLIINLLKEKNNCNCRNCGCPNNCQSNGCPNNMMLEPMAQIFGGYSSQKMYSPDSEDSSKGKKKDDEIKSDNEKNNKKTVIVDSNEYSEENDSEYIEDGDE